MVPTPAEERAVIVAVTYSALFDYPLTSAQLAESLPGITADGATVARWWAASPVLRAAIERHHGFFFPRGRRDTVRTRLAREAISRRLLDRSRALLAIVACLPFVRMVALSGSLAHLNADEDGDLDLFVITAPGRVWLVTLSAIVLARLLGWRRRLCLNYVVSERALPVDARDLFSANQILHLQPVAGAPTYQSFLAANPEVWAWYPNFVPRPLGAWTRLDTRAARLRRLLEWPLIPFAALADRMCRAIYRRHLARRSGRWRSREQVRLEPECLKLHTDSHRAPVLARLMEALAARTPVEHRLTG